MNIFTDSTVAAQNKIGEVFGQFEKMITTLSNSIETLGSKKEENEEKAKNLFTENVIYQNDIVKAAALRTKLEALLNPNRQE